MPVRALRGGESDFGKRGLLGSFRTMLRQYASHEVEGLTVELEYETGAGGTLRKTVTTDTEGFAHFEIPFEDEQTLPMNSGWERAKLRWSAHKDGGDAGQTTAFVLAPGRDAGIGVISDIDDTILETGITGNARAILRNWKRVLIQMPGQRVAVPGAQDFYSALGGDAGTGSADMDAAVPQARPRPVFYVSSSPWNLFTYLVAFKRQRDMPLGPIMLRDWGFNRKTLGSEGHGSHKEDAIIRILETYPHLRFAMVGDDTQKDLVAFGSVVDKMPDRIAAVFIRRVAEEALSAKEEAARVTIEAKKVPLWMGADYRQASEFLKQSGLELDGSMETLVETASEGKASPHAESGV
ncbi:phosphatase domain-containing protein [Erythrobacter ani]|uniref:phosphatase domain-containing protein n=1 Tax=Erythrobacter ani TaxID=2827235 RepID=UPI002106B348|nr:phosphatase domain-containing protein [Erythrobacter ani]